MMRVRMMEPRDLPRVWRAAAAQNRRDGTSYPVPEIFELDAGHKRFGLLKPNVVLALVTEIDGRVRQGHVWLRTVEEMSFGGGKEAMAFSGAHIPMALAMLAAQGYDSVHTFVPKQRLDDLVQMLQNNGLARVDQRLAHFFKMI
jgi:hypothetical protein